MRIIVTEKGSIDRFEITNLNWFAEKYVSSFDNMLYSFEFILDDKDKIIRDDINIRPMAEL